MTTTIIINPTGLAGPPCSQTATAQGYWVRKYTGADCAEINDQYCNDLNEATSLHAEAVQQWERESRNNDTESAYYMYGKPVLYSVQG